MMYLNFKLIFLIFILSVVNLSWCLEISKLDQKLDSEINNEINNNPSPSFSVSRSEIDIDSLSPSSSQTNPSEVKPVYFIRDTSQNGRQENLFGPFFAPLNFLLPSSSAAAASEAATNSDANKDDDTNLNQAVPATVPATGPMSLLQQFSSFQLPSLSSLLAGTAGGVPTTMEAAEPNKEQQPSSSSIVAPIVNSNNNNAEVDKESNPSGIVIHNLENGNVQELPGNKSFLGGGSPFGFNIQVEESKEHEKDKPHHHHHHHNHRPPHPEPEYHEINGQDICDRACGYKGNGTLDGADCYCNCPVSNCCQKLAKKLCRRDCDCEDFCGSAYWTDYEGVKGFCEYGSCICKCNPCDEDCPGSEEYKKHEDSCY